MNRKKTLGPDTTPGTENTCQSELFKAIVESTSAAHFIINGDRFVYANQAFEGLTGYKGDEISCISVCDFLSCDPAAHAPNMHAASPGSARMHFETEITTKNGESKSIAVTIVPVQIDPGTAVLGTATDVTVYKQREDTLSRSKRKYETVFSMAPDMIFIHNTEGIMVDINPVAAERLGYTRDEIVNRIGVLDSWTEEYKDSFEKIREATFSEGQWFGEIEGVDVASGQVFTVESRAKVAELGGETIIIVISRDVTERKKMEERLRSALREKELLLREIHHRVKNNLQIILSLLRLQLRNATNEEARALFRESQNRIMSIAMIHEKLYQSEGLHKIDLRDYIDDLAREVFISFGKDADSCILRTEIEDIALEMNTVIPCGLIIIELISNSLKHAFPRGRQGEVFIGLHAHGQRCLRLTVRDNGTGIPEDVNISTLESLGLRLVSDLARYQLEGEMEVSRDEGTCVNVTFKKERKGKRRE